MGETARNYTKPDPSFFASSFWARLPFVVRLVHGPHELPLVVLGHPGYVGTAGDDAESHQLQGIQDYPRGQTELCALQTIVLVLRLVLNLNKWLNHYVGKVGGWMNACSGVLFIVYLLCQDAHFIVVEPLNGAPILDGVLPDKNVRHSSSQQLPVHRVVF